MRNSRLQGRQTVKWRSKGDPFSSSHVSHYRASAKKVSPDPRIERFCNPDTAEAAMDDVEKVFLHLQYSANRLDMQAYQKYGEMIGGLIPLLNARHHAVGGFLYEPTREYAMRFGVFSRLNPWGRAARFRREHINPLAKEQKYIARALEQLEDLRGRVNEAIQRLKENPALFEAEVMFNLAYEDYSSTEALAFSRALLGRDENLEDALEKFMVVYNYLCENSSAEESQAAFLAASLYGREETKVGFRKQVCGWYDAFYEEYDHSVGVMLTLGLILTGQKVERAKEIYEALYNQDDVSEEAAAMLSFVLLIKGQGLEGVSEGANIYRDLASVEGLDDESARILTPAIMLRKGLGRDEVIETFQKVLEFENMDETNGAALLAAALIMTGAGTRDFDEAETIYQGCYEIEGVDALEAASLASAILLRSRGGHLPEIGAIPRDMLDMAVSGSINVLPTMLALNIVTGGVDGNRATPF